MSSHRELEQPVTCRVCGTANERFYTYCRNCLQTLPARSDAQRSSR